MQSQMHENFPTIEERTCNSEKEARGLFSGDDRCRALKFD